MAGQLNKREILWNNILWLDEAKFHVDGFVNKRNCHFRAENKPGFTVKRCKPAPDKSVSGKHIFRQKHISIRKKNYFFQEHL